MLTPNITEWLMFYDACERTYNARDHPGFTAAFLALATFDHSLSASDRMAARIARWRRDAPDDPLPDDRARWAHCLCRVCAAERLAQVGQLAPWQRQQRTLKKQQQRKKDTPHVRNA